MSERRETAEKENRAMPAHVCTIHAALLRNLIPVVSDYVTPALSGGGGLSTNTKSDRMFALIVGKVTGISGQTAERHRAAAQESHPAARSAASAPFLGEVGATAFRFIECMLKYCSAWIAVAEQRSNKTGALWRKQVNIM